MEKPDIASIADCLKQGGLIAYPSEAVFGIGCLPDRPKAVKKLLNLKKRSPEKGLILVAGSLSQLLTWVAPLSPDDAAKIQARRPRATTWVVPTRDTTPPLLTGHRDTIAVRISSHPLIQSLCGACNSALISTSANVSGEAPAKTTQELDARLAEKLDLVIDEPCLGEERPSQIIDLRTGIILRD